MYLEGKRLKTTDDDKRRIISVGKKGTKHMKDGLVVIIPQDDFNRYREELIQLREIDSTDYSGENIQLKESIQTIQKEKNLLEEKVKSQQKEINDLSSKLEYAYSNDMLEELKATNNKRVSDLKEAIAKKEKEVQDNMDTINSLRQQKENEIGSLRKEKEEEIKSLRKEKDKEISNLIENMRKVENDKANLETTFGMLLKDYQNLSNKKLVKLFYRKNDDIKHYEDFLNNKSLQRKETYSLPMEKEE